MVLDIILIMRYIYDKVIFMQKKILLGFAFVFMVFGILLVINIKNNNKKLVHKKELMVIGINNDLILVDSNDCLYSFTMDELNLDLGDSIVLEYIGDINDKNILSYKKIENIGNGRSLFRDYEKQAYGKLSELSLEEKIGQLVLARYPEEDKLATSYKYKLGGYVFFAKDFKNKSKEEVIRMIKNLDKHSSIPLLIAVDEEGGKVVRVSSNPLLVATPFKSSKELYRLGGLSLIEEDTIIKSNVLNSLGINLNLAPVVDVSIDSNDYMYERALGEDAKVTTEYAKTVIKASLGSGVSYVLKHFPGYGNNIDTHTGTSYDSRSYEFILKNDILPFKGGIESSAEAIMISHNVVSSIDPSNPASISFSIHNILRDDLEFGGIIITDSLDMKAISKIDNVNVKAVLSLNNLIITTDYEKFIDDIKTAINNGVISEALIDRLVLRNLEWKYYKGLM